MARLDLDHNQTLAAFFSSSAKHVPPPARAGAGKKTVFISPLSFGRLIGSSHEGRIITNLENIHRLFASRSIK